MVHRRPENVRLVEALASVHAEVALCLEVAPMVDQQLEDLVVVASSRADDRRTRAKQEEGTILRRDLLIERH